MKDYDSTVARIAGNILSRGHGEPYEGELVERDLVAVEWAVTMALQVVAECRARARVTADADLADRVQVTQDWLDSHARVKKA